MPYRPLKPFVKGNFILASHLQMCYKRVLKAGYLMMGVLSNHFKVPVNSCWESRVTSINNKFRLHEGATDA